MVDVGEFDKYGVKVHGYGRLVIRNRQFLRKVVPYGEVEDRSTVSREHTLPRDVPSLETLPALPRDAPILPRDAPGLKIGPAQPRDAPTLEEFPQ